MRTIDADGLKERIKTGLGIKSFEHLLPAERYIVEQIDHMPTIQPKQRTGHWIKKYWHGENIRECSVCHVTQSVTVHEGKVMFKFCPYCGMKMMEGEDNG